MSKLNPHFQQAALANLSSIPGPFAQRRLIANLKFLRKATLTSIVVFGIYQSLLTGLETEALRKGGRISRSEQIQILTFSVLKTISNGASSTILFGVLLLCFPWLSVPFSILGLLGASKASIDVFNVFWARLEKTQQEELLQASLEAGINLRRFIHGKYPESTLS